MTDLVTLRTALIITLSIILVFVLWRRLRNFLLTRAVPVVRHAELGDLEVVYHPERLRLEVLVPSVQLVRTTLLDLQHTPMYQWDDLHLDQGQHIVELKLPVVHDGLYYLEVSTATQRTERQFRLTRT